MFIDEVLGSQNAFGKFYAYCQTRGDGAKRKVEFLQMVRVLNPGLGIHARDFFPPFLRTTQERAAHLYSVMHKSDFSIQTLSTIHGIAGLGQLGEHSFDLAYIEILAELSRTCWEVFVRTSEGESIGASFYGTVAERDARERTFNQARQDNADAFARLKTDPDPGTPSRRKIEAEAVRQAVSKELEGLNLSPEMAELMLRQRTDEGLKAMSERRQAPIAREPISPLAPQAVRPQLYRPSSRSPVPMPLPAPAVAPVAPVVLPAAVPVRGVHHRRAHIVFPGNLQSPAAAASASSAAAAQGRAKTADALRRQGKCVPASLSAAPVSAAAARKRPIHFRIVDAKP